MTEQELVELLSGAEHAGWAHWQSYLFSVCEQQEDGSMTIPAALVDRWERQIATPYAQLTEREKQSDRNEVAKILPIIRAFVDAQKSKATCAVCGLRAPESNRCPGCRAFFCDAHYQTHLDDNAQFLKSVGAEGRHE